MERIARQVDDDVESQVTSRSSRSEGPPEEFVGTSMSPTKCMQWQAAMGTKPLCVAGHYNGHGLLAAQRYVAEKFACFELLSNPGATIVDVGGAPHRTYDHLGGRGWFMMPQVHVADRTRRGRVPTDAAQNVCAHRFEECRCVPEKRAFLFTHSAYYIDPLRLWQELMDEDAVDAIAVEHCFDDVFGGFYHEASWFVTRDVVTMSVVDNAAPYVHVLPPWQSMWRGGKGEAFEIEVLKVLDGVTRVVRITPGFDKVDAEKKTLIWDEVEAHPNFVGPVQFSSAARNAVADNARFTQITFDVHEVYKIGPFLYTNFIFKGTPVTLTVPVNGVATVANTVGSRTRSPELLEEVAHALKNRWGRARIPPGLLHQTVTATVALGFVAGLKFEIGVYQTMLERFSWAFDAHARILKFEKLRLWRWTILVGVLAALLLAVVLGDYFDKDVKDRLIITFSAALFFGLCICGLGVGARVHQEWVRRTEAGWVSTYGDPDGPRAPLLGNNFRISRQLMLPGTRYVRPDHEEIMGQLKVGVTKEREFEPNRLVVSGILADGAVPNALHTTQAAERSAVTNRILAPRRNPGDEALQMYKAVFGTSPYFRFTAKVDSSWNTVKLWIDKMRKSYSKAYIDNMIETWKRYVGTQADPVATKGFLKIEKSASTVKTDSAKATKPRLIQPGEDIDKVMTGWAIWQLYEAIREQWNGYTSPILYCSGRSNEYIGEAVDGFIEDCGGDVVCWSVDMASYDATLGLQLQKPAFEWYKAIGMPGWVESWLMRVRTRGTTPNGVYYAPEREYWFEDEEEAKNFAAYYKQYMFKVKVSEGVCVQPGHKLFGHQAWCVRVEDFQMTSGRMDTNLTDTVALTAAMLSACLIEKYLLLVCGDDAALFVMRKDECMLEPMKQQLLGLGLNPEGKISGNRWEWEFCSKLFWWAVDPENGMTKTVLGSKPFRGIARMGVNTTLPGAANAAAAALSVRIDSGHVPFLAPFADRTYELCREKKIRPVGKVEWSAIRGERRLDPSPRNYELTLARYCLGEENELKFRSLLQSLHSVPVVLHYPPMEDAIAVDEA